MKILLKEKDQELLKECKHLLKENPNIKKRKLDFNDLEKRLYYIQVWVITESQPLHVLRNYEKRCFRGKDCYHLDHIVPISHGFYNKIPPEKIGGMSNLRFIKSERNMRKGHRLTTESHKVLRKIRRRI
jgi:hypothetical protein